MRMVSDLLAIEFHVFCEELLIRNATIRSPKIEKPENWKSYHGNFSISCETVYSSEACFDFPVLLCYSKLLEQ